MSPPLPSLALSWRIHHIKAPIKAMTNPIMATFAPPAPINVAAPPVKLAGGGPVVEYRGLPTPVPVADGARVRVELRALGGARMMSLGTAELVGTAMSGRVLVATSLLVTMGRVAITTAVPRIRVRVTVNVEVEVEVVVASAEGSGTTSCGRAVASQGRRRMARERGRCGGRIAAV